MRQPSEWISPRTRFRRVRLDDLLLPWLKFDAPFVLPARAVLREQAWPVRVVRRDRDAVLPLDPEDVVSRTDCLDRPGTFVDESGPGVRACDAQRVRPRESADASITEVKAEEIGIAGSVGGRNGRVGAPAALGRTGTQRQQPRLPSPKRPPGDAGLLAHGVEAAPLRDESQGLLTDCDVVHAREHAELMYDVQEFEAGCLRAKEDQRYRLQSWNRR